MRFYFLSLGLLLGNLLIAQEVNLEAFNTKRLQIDKTGMTILGSWAAGNIGVSAVGLASQGSEETRAFHQMNIGWGAVNLLIAGLGYQNANRASSALDLISTIKEQEKVRSILLFNSGLDLGYIVGGFYLLERAKNDLSRQDQLNGFGKAVIMNGSFLFLFDVLMVYAHSRHGKTGLYQLANVMKPVPGGIAFQFKF
jgi:hypothetical protein